MAVAASYPEATPCDTGAAYRAARVVSQHYPDLAKRIQRAAQLITVWRAVTLQPDGTAYVRDRTDHCAYVVGLYPGGCACPASQAGDWCIHQLAVGLVRRALPHAPVPAASP